MLGVDAMGDWLKAAGKAILEMGRLVRYASDLVETANRQDDLYRALTMMDDAALARRGIRRGDIPAVVAREFGRGRFGGHPRDMPISRRVAAQAEALDLARREAA